MSARRYFNASFAAAAGYLVVAAISVVKPQPDNHWNAAGRALEAAFIVGLVGSAVAIAGVTAMLSRRPLGTRAGRLAQIGFVGLTVSSVASLIKGGNTLGPVFVLSLLATLVGLLLLGIAGLREGLVARWLPVLPFATMLIGIALAEHGGCAVIAAGWIAMALGLFSTMTSLRQAAAPA